MSKFSLGAILALVSLVPNIQADEKPAPDTSVIRAQIRIMTVGDNLIKQCSFDPSASVHLTEKELDALLKALKVQGGLDVLSMPIVVVQSGQTGTVECGQTQPFVTNLNVVTANDQKIYQPIQTACFLGTGMTVKATDLKAKNAIALEVRAEQTQLDGPVPLFPITTIITPVFEGGAKGKPVPFTQFIQQPKFQKIITHGSTKLSSGDTFLLMSDPFSVETREETKVPVVSEIPYLGRMFTNVGYGRESRRLLIAVTPEFVTANELPNPTMGEVVGALVDAPCKNLPKPVAQYQSVRETIVLDVKTAKPDCPTNGFYKPLPTGGFAGITLNSSSCPLAPVCAACPAKHSDTMNLADIAALTASGVSDEVILNQIRTLGATFTLGTEQIIWLKTQKVSDAVIVAMQNARPVPTRPTPPPMKILPPAPMPAVLNKSMQPYRIDSPNSKEYYIITDLTGSGEQVYCFPITGNDTVLDAISNIKVLPAVASKSDIWLTRKTSKEEQVLMVDYAGIARDGITTTNYQVLPGDRIYVNSPRKMGVNSFRSQPGDVAPVPPAFAQTRLTEEDGREIGKAISQLVGDFINEVAELLQDQMTDESTSQRDDQSRLERDPNYWMRQMLLESENLRNPQEEKHLFWMNQQPSALTYDRLTGAISK